MDPRIGCCIDVGHTVRAGTDVVQAIHEVGPRLFNMHMKDLTNFQSKESQVAWAKASCRFAGSSKRSSQWIQGVCRSRVRDSSRTTQCPASSEALHTCGAFWRHGIEREYFQGDDPQRRPIVSPRARHPFHRKALYSRIKCCPSSALTDIRSRAGLPTMSHFPIRPSCLSFPTTMSFACFTARASRLTAWIGSPSVKNPHRCGDFREHYYLFRGTPTLCGWTTPSRNCSGSKNG